MCWTCLYMSWHILKTDLHVSTVPILTVLSRHCKFQSKMLLNWLVPGGPHMSIITYKHVLHVYKLMLIQIQCIFLYLMQCVHKISTSMSSLSLVPTPWPKEFTPRYHQLHRVVARQRNFDRWREQLRPLRWKFYGETLGIWWVHTVMEYVEEPAWYRV